MYIYIYIYNNSLSCIIYIVYIASSCISKLYARWTLGGTNYNWFSGRGWRIDHVFLIVCYTTYYTFRSRFIIAAWMVSSLVYFWMNGLNQQHLTLISLATHSIKRGAVVIMIKKTKINPSNQNEDASCIAYIEETQERWGYSLWLWFNSGDIATPVWRKELCHFARVLYMYVDRACRFPTGGIVFSLLFPFTKTTLLHFVRYAICILYFTLLFATVLLFILYIFLNL